MRSAFRERIHNDHWMRFKRSGFPTRSIRQHKGPLQFREDFALERNTGKRPKGSSIERSCLGNASHGLTVPYSQAF